MQFIVTGTDGTDPGAPHRRADARERHLEQCALSKARGELLCAAALLNEDGQMCGSVMIVDYPSREALDAWLEREPYITDGVWESLDIRPCRVPALFTGGQS